MAQFNHRNTPSISKDTVLALAWERHLEEVAYYWREGNAEFMWGKPEVRDRLDERMDFRAFAASQK